jgi:hypothetical protein
MLTCAKDIKKWKIEQIMLELVKFFKRKEGENFDSLFDYVNFTTNVGEMFKLENWTGILNLHKRTKI